MLTVSSEPVHMPKIIGKKKERTPQEYHYLQCKLIEECNNSRPYKKPKGLVLKFRTWEDLYEFNRTRAARQM